MTKTTPLDERIATALTGQPTAAQLAALLDEAAEADRKAEADALAARERALDPATPPAAVAEARKVMEDAQFTRDRLAAAVEKLQRMHREAVRAEAEAERQAKVAEITARRDAMVDELRTEYPAMVAKAVDLFERLIALDAECLEFGVESAEQVARPGKRSPGLAVAPLTHGRLAAFEISHEPWAWSEHHQGRKAASIPRRVTVATKRVIVTNKASAPRGINLATGRSHLLQPGETSPEVLMTEAEMAGVLDLDFQILGTGEPVTHGHI